tara:strand:- start:7661 stop:8050 length:390 start_codon:yes stop_codon:yes gene_type:complete
MCLWIDSNELPSNQFIKSAYQAGLCLVFATREADLLLDVVFDFDFEVTKLNLADVTQEVLPKFLKTLGCRVPKQRLDLCKLEDENCSPLFLRLAASVGTTPIVDVADLLREALRQMVDVDPEPDIIRKC